MLVMNGDRQSPLVHYNETAGQPIETHTAWSQGDTFRACINQWGLKKKSWPFIIFEDQRGLLLNTHTLTATLCVFEIIFSQSLFSPSECAPQNSFQLVQSNEINQAQVSLQVVGLKRVLPLCYYSSPV